MPQIDTRLIQTAVMGGKDGDRPVILPEEAHNLDEFRRQYGQTNFWCGTLLGGCGEKLMTKRYETKVCHFAHHPDRYGTSAECHRTSEGADGADHLFIKQHVKDWLTGQGHAAEASLRTLGTGPGDAVDFWLRATEQHLRFELRPEDYRRWRKAAESLGAREGHVEWVFGPENTITHDMVARQGYALRVRCETKGTDRRVLIGTVTADRPVVWEPLASCRMTRDGMVTPALENLRSAGKIRVGGMRNAPLPTSLPMTGAQIVFAVDGEAAEPTNSPFEEKGRRLYAGYLKPTAKRIIRGLLSLPADTPPPSDDFVYQLSGAVRLLLTDPIGTAQAYWAVRADVVTQLNGLDAERTGLWRPSVALDAPVSAPTPAQQQASEERPPAASAQQIRGGVRSRQATALRKGLVMVARRGGTTTWQQLAQRIDPGLRHLSDNSLRNLLVEADHPVSENAVPLSVLVLAPGGQKTLPYLSAVLRDLGIDAPVSDAELQRWSTEAIRRLHTSYERRNTSPLNAESPPTSPVITRPPNEANREDASRKMRLLREKIEEVRQTAARREGDRAARLTTSLEAGEAHLHHYTDACKDAHALRRWRETSRQLLRNLEDLVGQVPELQASAVHPSTPAPPAAPHPPERPESPPSEPLEAAHSTDQSASLLPRMSESFIAAKASGDVTSVRRFEREAIALAGSKASAQTKLRARVLRDEMRTWIKARESDEALESMRTVFETLPSPGDPREAERLRSALEHVNALRRLSSEALTQDLSDSFSDLEHRLHAAQTAAEQSARPAPARVKAERLKDDSSDQTAALADFIWLVSEIEAAREADDLESVEAARRLAGPLYARRLAPEDRERFTPFMREVKAWCGAHRSRPETVPVLKAIRQLFTKLDMTRTTATVWEIGLVLDTMRELRHKMNAPLPSADEKRLVGWEARLRQRSLRERTTARREAAPDRTARRRPDAVAGQASSRPERLSLAAIERLAAPAREVLMDAARAGGAVLTWGDLRARLKEPLPYLHPDDQGELLVAVDRDTPQDEPLLTTLMASADISQHWLYPHVRFSLHRPRIPEEELAAHWAREVLKLRQIWRHR
ncbi:hypothetical protein ACH4WW_28685 [Streptomyces halstedii]|uniref:hypothetical protein n=1 Tax=Streptomyces halstedii TaxID=1944 RepID=UPI0037ADBA92